MMLKFKKLKLGLVVGLLLVGIIGVLKMNDFNLFSSAQIKTKSVSAILKCNTNHTDSSGKCSIYCGASPWCDSIAPLEAIPYCAKGGSTAIHDRCSSNCQPEDGVGMICRMSGISDCTGDSACDLSSAGRCSSNPLKKCNANCVEVDSCGDGKFICGETAENCPSDAIYSNKIYLDNGEIKVGVDLDWGGIITEIIYNGVNLVDKGFEDRDETGRSVQASFYAAGDDINKWNPNQGGSAFTYGNSHYGSPIIEYNQSDNLIYTKTRAYNWWTDEDGDPVLSDIYIEQWVSLVPKTPNAIKVRYKMNYFGDKYHVIAPQSFPVVFLNKAFYKCITYNSDNPWTKDNVIDLDVQLQSTEELGTHFYPTEYWASFVDDQNFGLTSYSLDHTPSWGAIRYNVDTQPSLLDTNPLFDISPNIIEEATQYYIVGDYNDARDIIYNLHSNEPSSPTSWEFNTDNNRERWFAYNELTGFDISNGTLKTSSLGGDPYMGFQSSLDIDGQEYKYIEIRMKVSAGNDAYIYFTTVSDHIFDANKIKHFSITSGNNFEIYKIDMSNVATWNDIISQIRLDPTNVIADIEIDYIRLVKDTAGCTDTDGGENIYKRGTTCCPSTVNPGELFCMADECLSTDLLKERYYIGDTIMSKTVTCLNGCNGGACAQKPEQPVCGDGICNYRENSNNCPEDCPKNENLSADLNCDNRVGLVDFAILLSFWGKDPSGFTSCKSSDINQDGKVNLVDFGIMMSQWITL